MKELSQCRAEIDAIDAQIVALFEKRMNLSREVAAYKIARGLPVLDQSREEQVLQSRCGMLEDDHWTPFVRALYEQIMALSRAEQSDMLREAHDA